MQDQHRVFCISRWRDSPGHQQQGPDHGGEVAPGRRKSSCRAEPHSAVQLWFVDKPTSFGFLLSAARSLSPGPADHRVAVRLGERVQEKELPGSPLGFLLSLAGCPIDLGCPQPTVV